MVLMLRFRGRGRLFVIGFIGAKKLRGTRLGMVSMLQANSWDGFVVGLVVVLSEIECEIGSRGVEVGCVM